MKREPPMTHDALPRSADPIDSVPISAPSATPQLRPLGGRRISFLAWGLAGLAGIAIWALIFKLI
ncbi:MAG TPA: hypothetical protein VKQ09_11190 [Sphingomonas sp.]|nr:hypothetical protein [Sphingomonas sp.]